MLTQLEPSATPALPCPGGPQSHPLSPRCACPRGSHPSLHRHLAVFLPMLSSLLCERIPCDSALCYRGVWGLLKCPPHGQGHTPPLPHRAVSPAVSRGQEQQATTARPDFGLALRLSALNPLSFPSGRRSEAVTSPGQGLVTEVQRCLDVSAGSLRGI